MPSNERRIRRVRIIAFFGFLALVDWYLYFWNIGHFFQGDAVFQLRYRPTSVTGLLRRFIELHPSGWYRPLANDVLEGILYPLLGLNPIGYRIPIYLLFLVTTAAVYLLALKISRRPLAAGIAAFFFNIHTTNAYITYDFSFLPELLYTLFYIVSVLSYLRYIESGDKSALRWSLAGFVASLLSKEAAVTLPLTLIALHWLVGSQSVAQDTLRNLWGAALRPLMAVRGHLLILAGYLLFAFGYLQLMNFPINTPFTPRPAEMESGSYHVALDSTILENADLALTWAFNIPREWPTDRRELGSGLIQTLKILRALTLAILLVILFTGGDRKTLYAAAAWFFLTVLPALPLLNHFLPYYLFLPMAGYSLLIGTALTFLYDKLSRTPMLGPAVVGAFLAVVLYASSISIHADIRKNILLGESADLAFNSLTDLKQLYPVLPPQTAIFIADKETPLWWHHESGGLIRMSYQMEDVIVRYASLGQQIPPDIPAGKIIVLRYDHGHLIDDTAAFRKIPSRFSGFGDAEGHTLKLSTDKVTAGDSYYLEIPGVRNAAAQITYTRDSGPIEVFGATLDGDGRAKFDVSRDTPKGLYRFDGFSLAGQPKWLQAEATLLVH